MPPLIRIAGVDPGSRKVGLALLTIDKGRPYKIEAQAITLNGSLEKRIFQLGTDFSTWLKTCQPHHVCLEDAFHHKNTRTLIQLSRIQGVLIWLVAQQGMPLFFYPPAQIKASLTRYGAAEKSQVAYILKKELGIPEDWGKDETDACAIAYCHFLLGYTNLANR